MSRIDLHHLIEATTAPERQTVTVRMPKLQVQELNAVPEAISLADGTPPDPIDVSGEITRRVERAEPAPAPRRSVDGSGDVTLIGMICSLSLIVCSALAWL